MITESVLSTTVYLPPSSYASPPSLSTPKALSLLTLKVFSHLSFVISQFGGVTTTSASDFPELKKAFYIALDVLSADDDSGQKNGSVGEDFVKYLCAQG
jgi:hypothetical protein